MSGKERDAETNLDYFGARYFSGAQGRFTSADYPLIDQYPSDPQSWNLYGYVRNNPLRNVDPDGHDCVYLNNAGTGIESTDNHSSSGECGNTGGYWVNGTVTGAVINDSSLTLRGTTNGTDTTSAYYSTDPDPGLAALQRGTQLAEPGVKAAAAGTAIVMGGAFLGMVPAAIGAGGTLTTLGAIPVGLQPGAVVGGYVLTEHAVEQAAERGVTLQEIETALEGVAKSNPQNGWDSVKRFYTATCEVRVNTVTGTIVTVINKTKR